MKARFIGNGQNDPEALTWGGVTFPLGEAVEVPEALAGRIAGNSHFEVVGDEDGDGDVDRDDLRATAEGLGIEVDGRWGETRLKREIKAAEKKAAKDAEDDGEE
ncbi:hypothetical protein [Albimonas pacifica]|uniref:EF-hand domain-containing protein n=1 Tax=Albimonas pacifica TaxID=1114924 RepID=A0A1I3LHQ8_9RHOB|nr:hypothetical protein [Albimonas pacifica]SFI84281.1 hypothetical protein SAMN05216258_11035 [Albimonas pacifica]